MNPERRRRIGELYDSIAARLAAVAAGRSGLPHDVAADAVQDVFLSVVASETLADRILAFSEPEAVRYLLTAIVHRAGREMTRRATIEARPLATIEALLAARGQRAGPAPIEAADAIRHALDELRSPYREVLVGLLVRRQSARDLAVGLHRPVNTIYQQIHRGLQQLHEHVETALKR